MGRLSIRALRVPVGCDAVRRDRRAGRVDGVGVAVVAGDDEPAGGRLVVAHRGADGPQMAGVYCVRRDGAGIGFSQQRNAGSRSSSPRATRIKRPQQSSSFRPTVEAGLGPVDEKSAFGEVPAALLLDVLVEVAHRGDHQRAPAIVADGRVVSDGVALAARLIAIDKYCALAVEWVVAAYWLRLSKTGARASRPRNSCVG